MKKYKHINYSEETIVFYEKINKNRHVLKPGESITLNTKNKFSGLRVYETVQTNSLKHQSSKIDTEEETNKYKTYKKVK